MQRVPLSVQRAQHRPLISFVGMTMMVATLLLATAAPARADLHTWVGGGSNGSWSDSSKWSGGVPGLDSNEQRPIVVRFDTNTVSTMNISGLVVDAIQFQGSGNVINGTGSQTLGLLGTQLSPNITSGAGANRIASTLPIALGGQLVTVHSAAGSLTLEAAITGGSNTTLRFTAGANAGTGVTGSIATGTALVASGELGLDNSTAAVVQSGIVQVGDGDDETATLRAYRSTQLAAATALFVNDDGIYDVGASTQAVAALTVDRGSVDVGVGGRVVVSASLSATGATVSGAGVLALGGAATLGSTSSGVPTTVSNRMELEGETTITVGDGPAATDATLSGVIDDVSGTTGALVKDGAGTLRLSPGPSNAYSGQTLVREGTLELKATTGRAIPPTTSRLQIGDSVGPAARASVVELAESDINSTTPVFIRPDGRLALGGFSTTIASLQNLGIVDLPAGSVLSVVGDASVSSRITGDGILKLSAFGPSDLTLPSTPVGPPHIEPKVLIGSATSIFVTDGITAELAGGIERSQDGTAVQTLTKTGFGTLVWGRSPADGPLGITTTVSQGTLVMNDEVSSSFAVEAIASLAGNGAVGPLTVAGTVEPTAPGLGASQATFAAGGRLRSTVPVSGAAPALRVSGGVTIDPAATLDLQLAPGANRATAPAQLGLVTKTAVGPIVGRFSGLADGAERAPGPGLAYSFRYGAGDGNDLVGQLRNAAPVPTIAGTPGARAAAEAGKPLALAASATDADGDPLTFSWDFGDGASATGPSVTHVYAAGVAGERIATVAVSDGRLAGTAAIAVDVAAPPAVTTPPAVATSPVVATPSPAATPPPGSGFVSPGPTPPVDTLAPTLTFTLAKAQRLSRKGTINARLQCSEACTVTVAASIRPPGRRAKVRTTSAVVPLRSGAVTTVPVSVPKPALAAVRNGLRRKQASTLVVTATARDGAGNAGTPIQLRVSLRR